MPTNPVIDHIDYNNTTYDIKDTTSGYISGGTNSSSNVNITPSTTSITIPAKLKFERDATDTKQLNISWDGSDSTVSGVWIGVTSAIAGAQTFTGTNNIQSAGSNTF